MRNRKISDQRLDIILREFYMKIAVFWLISHALTMTRLSKWKIKVKEQKWDNNGKFTKRLKLIDECNEWDEWEDENNSKWDNEISLLNEKKAFEDEPLELTWSDNTHLEQKNIDYILLKKLKNQHILISMDQVVLLQKLQKELQK